MGKIYGDTGKPDISQVGTAPGYVNNQFNQGSKPHGSNIMEERNLADTDTRDGLKRALASEPGSQDDPSRLAERHMGLEDTAAPSSGTRQSNVDEENPYDTLDRNTST